MKIYRIAIFASGAGTNAQNIIHYFCKDPLVQIILIAGNNQSAGIRQVAELNNIPFLLVEKNRFKTDGYVRELTQLKIDTIILAGFLLKVPIILIKQFSNNIINIHPALLPKYGGKGMFGMKVHEAVIASNETKSGITIHLVDEIYDHGKIIFQATCPIEPEEDANSLCKKVRMLEIKHYPLVISKFISNK